MDDGVGCYITECQAAIAILEPQAKENPHPAASNESLQTKENNCSFRERIPPFIIHQIASKTGGKGS